MIRPRPTESGRAARHLPWVFLGLLVVAPASADTIDPFLPTTVTVGASDAIAATSRLGAGRTGWSD